MGRLVDMFAEYLAQSPPPPTPTPCLCGQNKEQKRTTSTKTIKIGKVGFVAVVSYKVFAQYFFTGQGNINIVKPYILTNEYPAYLEC